MNAELTITDPTSSQRILSGAGAISMLGGFAAVGYFDPTTAGFFPVCPLFTLTGFACPGCGLTRGFHALFHGDVLTALDYNALLPFYALFFAYLAASLFAVAVRGRGFTFKPFQPKIVYGFLVVSLAFAVVRN